MRHRPSGTASGAEQEFRAFVHGMATPLHRTAFLLCGDWHLADDLVQETLAKAYSHWRKVRRADNPSAYVRRILINESRRHWRRQRHATPEAAADVADIAAPDLSDGVVNRADLVRALQSLPLRHRRTAWRATAGGGFAVAAVVAVAVAVSGSGVPAPAGTVAGPAPTTPASSAPPVKSDPARFCAWSAT
ncbi:sigma factor [Actinoplanes sp. NPDC051411]|uniref:sigma factor n=1 Tax=Actinoplanes sp. NPDC051411 TaxID=3155522 RepID=UPI00343A405F